MPTFVPGNLGLNFNASSYRVPLKSNVLFTPQEITLPKGL